MMTRRTERWPMWKIGAGAGGCAVAAIVLFWLSAFLDKKLAGPEPADPSINSFLGLSGFVLVLGLAMAILAVLGFIWLGVRIHEARTPPWERRGKSKRR